jgi:hypothetical protein
MAMHLCLQLVKKFAQKLLPNLVEKTKQWYVLPKYNKILAYVKDEGSNLNVMTIILQSIVSYECLGLDESL